MLGSMVSLSPDRFMVMDYTPVIDVPQHTIMVKYPSLGADMAGFIKPYPLDVRFICTVEVKSPVPETRFKFNCKGWTSTVNCWFNIHIQLVPIDFAD